MKNKLMIACCLLTVLIGCKKDDDTDLKTDETNNQAQTFDASILDISDANTLTVLENASNGDNSNLYKFTSSNNFEKVEFVNQDGSKINDSQILHRVNVSNLHIVNEDFILLFGSFKVRGTNGNEVNYNSLLVNKSSGQIFDFQEFNLSNNIKLGDETFQKDGNGHIYYLNGNKEVIKLDISNPNSPVKSKVLSTGQTADYFEIDDLGNCIYKYGESSGVTNSNGTDDLRIRKPTGQIFELKVPLRDNKEFWIGNNGKIYFISYDWNNGYQPLIHTANFINDSLVIDTVWGPNNEEEKNAVGNFFRTGSQGSYLLRKTNSVLFVNTYHGWVKHFEFNESNNSVNVFNLPNVDDDDAIIINSDSYYYIATGTDLYKVSLSDNSHTKILNSGEYEIYSMEVNNLDQLRISALRFLDGKKVFIEIDQSGNLTTINEAVDRKGIILKQIN